MPDSTDNPFNHTSAIPGLVPVPVPEDSPGDTRPRENPFKTISYEHGTFLPSPEAQAPVTFRSKGSSNLPFTATVGGPEIRQGESPLEKRRRQELRDQFVLLQDKVRRVISLLEEHNLKLGDTLTEHHRALDENIHTPLSLVQEAIHSRNPISDETITTAKAFDESKTIFC